MSPTLFWTKISSDKKQRDRESQKSADRERGWTETKTERQREKEGGMERNQGEKDRRDRRGEREREGAEEKQREGEREQQPAQPIFGKTMKWHLSCTAGVPKTSVLAP